MDRVINNNLFNFKDDLLDFHSYLRKLAINNGCCMNKEIETLRAIISKAIDDISKTVQTNPNSFKAKYNIYMDCITKAYNHINSLEPMALNTNIKKDILHYIKKKIQCDVHMDQKIEKPTPFKKLLFIEDGSVDVDTLTNVLEDTNPEIKIVVYMQGSRAPFMMNVEDLKND